MSNKLTLSTLLRRSCNKFKDRLCMKFVDGDVLTYSDFYTKVTQLANYFISKGIRKGDKIAIYSENMPNWGISQFAITSIGAVTVPILPGFSCHEIQNILAHSETKLLVVSKQLFKTVEGISTPQLKHRLLINNWSEIPEGIKSEEINSLNNSVALSNSRDIEVTIDEEDTASIIYTSGTTGFSKGVELTHRNIVWNAQQCRTIQNVNEHDRFLSILPLAHTYENTIGFLLPIMTGASIYYIDGLPSPTTLIAAMQKVKPTTILSVPLIIEKIYKQRIAPKLTGSKMCKFFYQLTPTRKLMHYMAGKQLMRTFGGEVRFFGIGGSKVDAKVEQFLYEAKFPYAIGYGLTETAPMSAGSRPFETVYQGVGKPMEGVEIKINEPNEEGQGEIWIRGPHVMKGYYKQPELTKEVLSKEGWFKTGDLGCLDKKGRLSIRGRIKTMILGASGENIYPEEIESIINNFKYVTESLVIERKGKLVAMVHLNMEELEKQFKKFKSQADNYKTAMSDYIEQHKKEIYNYVNARVNSFSKLQYVLIQTKPFEKTPTHKIKRFLYK